MQAAHHHHMSKQAAEAREAEQVWQRAEKIRRDEQAFGGLGSLQQKNWNTSTKNPLRVPENQPFGIRNKELVKSNYPPSIVPSSISSSTSSASSYDSYDASRFRDYSDTSSQTSYASTIRPYDSLSNYGSQCSTRRQEHDSTGNCNRWIASLPDRGRF